MNEFTLDSFVPPITCTKDKNHAYASKSIGGRLLCKDGRGYSNYTFKHVSLESIGINRKLGSVEIEMLYSYIGISPGTKFRGLIVDTGNNVEEAGIIGRVEIYVGRGISRGLAT